MCLVLTVVYGALGALLLRVFLRLGPAAGDARALVTRRLRVFAIGGFLSYRALFGWLTRTSS